MTNRTISNMDLEEATVSYLKAAKLKGDVQLRLIDPDRILMICAKPISLRATAYLSIGHGTAKPVPRPVRLRVEQIAMRLIFICA